MTSDLTLDAIIIGAFLLLLATGLLTAWWAIDHISTAQHAAPARRHRPTVIPATPGGGPESYGGLAGPALREDVAGFMAAPVTGEHSPDWAPRPALPAYAAEVIGHGGDVDALIDSLYTKAMAAHITAVTA